jgi:predicted TIM-barrel fold metal-dependent hydrolase
VKRRRLLAAGVAAPFAPRAADEAPIPFIDAHVHLNDEAMQLALMDRFQVERAIVFWGRGSNNQSVADAARRHPRRFVAFASVSPERAAYRRYWQPGADAQPMLDELDALLASGAFAGIGEINAVHAAAHGFPEADFPLDGAAMQGIATLARKHRMPLLLHVEAPMKRLAEFERLLQAHRDLTVLWAHGGYTTLPDAERVLADHPNVIYELSARTWPEHPRSPDYTILGPDRRTLQPGWRALIEAQPHRFVVGTDASHRAMAGEVLKHASVGNVLGQLSPAARQAVGQENLRVLLRG